MPSIQKSADFSSATHIMANDALSTAAAAAAIAASVKNNSIMAAPQTSHLSMPLAPEQIPSNSAMFPSTISFMTPPGTGNNPFFEKMRLRRGKWTMEEEKYAKDLVQQFENGTVSNCDNGSTLRAFLSRRLHCAPMRISKKFAGQGIGKHVFLSRASPGSEFATARTKLHELEMQFYKSLLHQEDGFGDAQARLLTTSHYPMFPVPGAFTTSSSMLHHPFLNPLMMVPPVYGAQNVSMITPMSLPAPMTQGAQVTSTLGGSKSMITNSSESSTQNITEAQHLSMTPQTIVSHGNVPTTPRNGSEVNTSQPQQGILNGQVFINGSWVTVQMPVPAHGVQSQGSHIPMLGPSSHVANSQAPWPAPISAPVQSHAKKESEKKSVSFTGISTATATAAVEGKPRSFSIDIPDILSGFDNVSNVSSNVQNQLQAMYWPAEGTPKAHVPLVTSKSFDELHMHLGQDGWIHQGNQIPFGNKKEDESESKLNEVSLTPMLEDLRNDFGNLTANELRGMPLPPIAPSPDEDHNTNGNQVFKGYGNVSTHFKMSPTTGTEVMTADAYAFFAQQSVIAASQHSAYCQTKGDVVPESNAVNERPSLHRHVSRKSSASVHVIHDNSSVGSSMNKHHHHRHQHHHSGKRGAPEMMQSAINSGSIVNAVNLIAHDKAAEKQARAAEDTESPTLALDSSAKLKHLHRLQKRPRTDASPNLMTNSSKESDNAPQSFMTPGGMDLDKNAMTVSEPSGSDGNESSGLDSSRGSSSSNGSGTDSTTGSDNASDSASDDGTPQEPSMPSSSAINNDGRFCKQEAIEESPEIGTGATVIERRLI